MNRFDPDLHRRRSIRLRNYDYAQEGLYFVTLCARNRECLFGEIVEGKMILNEWGKTLEKCWFEIPRHYPDTALHNHVVMPNHFHGIIEITNSFVGAENFPPSFHEAGDFHEGGAKDFHKERAEDFPPLHRNCASRTLGAIIRGFKIGTTKNIGYSPWQRNYYEHIIRNTDDCARIDEYIAGNPSRWEVDCFYM